MSLDSKDIFNIFKTHSHNPPIPPPTQPTQPMHGSLLVDMSAACWSLQGWSLHDTHDVTWSTEDPYYCYKLMAGPEGFFSAESGCGAGAQLTPIDNQAENNYVAGLM